MFARKLMLLMAALTAGLISFRFVVAEDPKPIPPVVTPVPNAPIAKGQYPQPEPLSQLSPLALPNGFNLPYPPADAKDAPRTPQEELDRQLKEVSQSLKPGEHQFVIEGTCIHVPIGFFE